MRVSRRQTARCRAAALFLGACIASSGCVYYNGIYNAKAAARQGDALLRGANDGEASVQFQLSAARAETVLVRYPKSQWRTRALYLAGRGAAFSGQCERALTQLRLFLDVSGTPADDRDRARVALATCEFRTNRIAVARLRLDSLVDAPNPETARQARLWSARAAMAVGDRDAVPQYLRDLDAGTLQWELIGASVAANEYARAESLLTAQAEASVYRDEAGRYLRDLWLSGRQAQVETIVSRFDRSRVREEQRASLYFAVGDLNLRAGRDSVARLQLALAAQRAGRDSVVFREATARLTALRIMTLASLRQLDSVVATQDSVVRATPFFQRVQEQLLFVSLLAGKVDPTGASLYLAAEVARDSLRSSPLAEVLFLRVAREVFGSPLAAQALFAAGLIRSDSAAIWNERIRADYPNSAIAAYLRGEDPANRADFISSPELLRFSWTEGARTWADSVRRLRGRARSSVAPIRK